jgi:predicted GIY-YIG superfamily endonuclease
MFYTYILKQDDADHFYVGFTSNLKHRVLEHAEGTTKSTSGRKWTLYCYFSFIDEKTARNFEVYLKTGSGRAFSKRRFGFKVDEALA